MLQPNKSYKMDQKTKNFALIGAAGYIAPKHLDAIKKTGNQLIAALDPNDSVGILDSYFPNTHFFTSFERFERFVVKQKLESPIDYFSICSPNHHHDTHCRFALINNADAICEKPLVLNPWNLEALKRTEEETSKSIFNILQLRIHPEIIALKKFVKENNDRVFDIDLTYITSRGPWYNISWKGDTQKSGGITTNIGIHFFDVLLWVFGDVESQSVYALNDKFASGILQLKKANVRWFLSVDSNHLSNELKEKGITVERSLTIDNKSFDFSKGFENLHVKSYQNILDGKGYTTANVSDVIQLGYDIRESKTVGLKDDYHPRLKKISF